MTALASKEMLAVALLMAAPAGAAPDGSFGLPGAVPSPASPRPLRCHRPLGRQAPARSGTPPFASCKEARSSGAAPLRRGAPGYSLRLDRDRDGIACE